MPRAALTRQPPGAAAHKADPPECERLHNALDAARAAAEKAIDEGGKSESESADRMTDADSADRKFTSTCRLAAKREGIDYHGRWARHVRDRQEALRQCAGLAGNPAKAVDAPSNRST